MNTTMKNVEQLQHALNSVKNYRTTMYIEVEGIIKEVQISVDEKGKIIQSNLVHSPGCLRSSHFEPKTVVEAFTHLAKICAGAIIYPETVEVESEQATSLSDLSRASWCEAFARPENSLSESISPFEFKQRILKDKLWKNLTGAEPGIQCWNALRPETRQLIDWSKSNLNGAKLKASILGGLDFKDSSFDKADLEDSLLLRINITNATFCGANMVKSKLNLAQADGADFTEARLKQAILFGASLQNAIFKNTDLTKADLQECDLRSVDLTSALLKDTKFTKAKYDEHTVLPSEFPQWSQMLWCGVAPDPFMLHVQKLLNELEVSTFDQFVSILKANIDASRLDKVSKMLKKERFELYSEVDDKLVTGIVKSQTNPDLTYACYLKSNGDYSCITQNVRPCGGLKGGMCKHVLVLISGLARTNGMDLTNAAKWILRSVYDPPKITGGVKLPEVFFKYKASEAGDIDWRPTETIPEDYYAF